MASAVERRRLPEASVVQDPIRGTLLVWQKVGFGHIKCNKEKVRRFAKGSEPNEIKKTSAANMFRDSRSYRSEKAHWRPWRTTKPSFQKGPKAPAELGRAARKSF